MEEEMSKLRIIARLKIHTGKLDEFKVLAATVLSVVQERCPGTLEYEWFLNSDLTECVVLETFASSEALLVHADAVAEHARQMFTLCDMLDIWLCGEPLAAVLERAAAFAPKPYAFLQGRH
jgi:quinol monooxygenase YgiN